MLDRVLRIGMLLDCYASFLTNVQREQCRLHFEEDYSLAEIAEMYGVSRQAVHDAINRAEASLEELEKKLGLVAKSQKLSMLHERVSLIVAQNDLGEEIEKELSDIRDQLSAIVDGFSGRSDSE